MALVLRHSIENRSNTKFKNHSDPILPPHFTAIVRRPAWAEDDDDDKDYVPVPTFQSAFTEALGAADWARSNSGGQGNAFVCTI